MRTEIQDWFLDHQVKIALGLGVVSVAIIFCLDERGPQALAGFALSMPLIYLGSRLLQGDTSENWLKTSYGDLIKNVAACVMMLFGWVMLLRGLVAMAIAAILLRAS